ncbi:MAG: agmatinase [Cyclobacteriaceae bacterium]|jgi:agmatinase|nr:agmatinase [Cyclobacteriaceae bacterium]
MVTVLGIPLDENSSFLQGAAAGPQCIRDAYHSPSANYWSESGIDLSRVKEWKDQGDLLLSPGIQAITDIERGIAAQLAAGHKTLSLGGDHSITYPIIKAYAKHYPGLNILHIDAHADLYHDFEGNPYSHASPFARIMEQHLVKRLVQVGIRTLTQHQREQAAKFGVEIIEMKDWKDDTELSFDGPLYISLDLDAMDPAFVPGVSHHEPGGFSVRQVLSIIQRVQGTIVGADIVELNPTRDIQQVTAMVAAKCFKELLTRMLH